MTDRVIAPVVPSSAGRHSEHAAGTRQVRMLPLAVPPTPPVGPTDVVYGMGRIDASGRVADRAITQALGWQAGDRLTLTGTPAAVLARRDPAGMVTVGRKPYVTIPAVLRDRCGLRAGDRVLLAATLDDHQLTVYPMLTVHEAIHSTVSVEGGEAR